MSDYRKQFEKETGLKFEDCEHCDDLWTEKRAKEDSKTGFIKIFCHGRNDPDGSCNRIAKYYRWLESLLVAKDEEIRELKMDFAERDKQLTESRRETRDIRAKLEKYKAVIKGIDEGLQEFLGDWNGVAILYIPEKYQGIKILQSAIDDALKSLEGEEK